MDWKTIEHEYAKDFAHRTEASTPEPLYESFLLPSPKVCLVCASRQAHSALYSGTQMIVPLCQECAADWNLYGYGLLKKVRPQQLILRLAKYKLFHWFSGPGVIEMTRDVKEMARWAKKMKTIMSGLDGKGADKGQSSEQ
jgi:hypothetical protein